MTQTFLALGEPLPVGSGLSLLSTDRGNVAALALVPSGGGGGITPADLLTTEQNVRYVDKGGSPSGTGSRVTPTLTIQQAIDLAKAAGATQANPFLIRVGVGTFTDAFLYEPGVFISGSGQTTTISNPNAQQLAPAFSAAGTQDTGLANAIVGTDTVLDFSAVGSPGAGRFFARALQLDGNWTCVGNNSSNRCFLATVAATGLVARTITCTNTTLRMAGSAFQGFNAVVNCNGTITAQFTAESWLGGVTINGTSGTNFAFFTTGAMLGVLDMATCTGDRCSYLPGYGSPVRITAPDADTTYVFGANVSAGALHAPANGNVRMILSPSAAPRTYTMIGGAGGLFTPNNTGAIEFVNGGSLPANITGTGITIITLEVAEWAAYRQTTGTIHAYGRDKTQKGRAKLTNGVSAFIPADYPRAFPPVPASGATCAILLTLSDPTGSTALGRPAALPAGIVDAARQSGGGFVITSLNAAGATEVGDQSVYDYAVVGV